MTCTDNAAEIMPGDRFEITVEATGAFNGEDTAAAHWCNLTDGRPVKIPDATLLAGRRVARPLAIGDRVTWRGSDPFVIIAIDAPSAWLKRKDWGHTSAPLAELERAPAPDTKEGTS